MTDRPNILFIFSDQQHWRAAGFEDPFFRTPNLDALAKDAMVFRQSFCTTPQCSPSRASMLTGLYPSKTGVLGNVGNAGGPPLRTATIGSLLRQGGYYTAYFGKWHLGDDAVGTAGWDEDFGVTAHAPLNDEEVTRRAVDLLSRHDGQKPLAMFLSYNDPHGVYGFSRHRLEDDDCPVPLGASWQDEQFAGKPAVQKQFMTHDQGRSIWGQDVEAWQHYRRYYRSRVELYDAHLGKVLSRLRQCGLYDKTVIVVTSDHGDMDTQHKLIFKGPFMYEHMMRVPLVIHVPKALGGRLGCAEQDVVNVDLVPTLLDLAGCSAIPCDGQSLRPLLSGQGGFAGRDFVVGQYYSKQQWVNPIRMIRTSRYKYNRYIGHGEELYDLVNDASELVNLAADPAYAAIKQDLAAKLDQWMQQNDDPFNTQEVSGSPGGKDSNALSVSGIPSDKDNQ